MEQLNFFGLSKKEQQQQVISNLKGYDYYIIAFSGGKDSSAAHQFLLEQGVDPRKIELWHHNIDGRIQSADDLFMDWPCTESYCRSYAEAHNIPIYFSWKDGGFLGEMMRTDRKSSKTYFETPDGLDTSGGGRGKKLTRRKFPAVGAIENGRWCSALLKIDVARSAITNQDRFRDKKVLFITGERADESPRRAKYNPIEKHHSDKRDGKRVVRHVDHWRPILFWDEADVWDILGRNNINVHPAYYLGIGRVSCAVCIFASPDQLATVNEVIPGQIKQVADKEVELDHTIRQGQTLWETIENGDPFPGVTKERINAAKSVEFTQPIFLENWKLPAGAFGDTAGPT